MSIALQTTYNAAPDTGYDGLLEGNYPHDIWTMKNAEASASIPFGSAVAFKLSSPATDLDVLLPASNSDLVAGLVVHSHAYARTWTASDGTIYGDLDGTGLRPGVVLNVLRKGKILVTCVTGCAVADRLFVSCSTSGGVWATTKGALGNAADSSATIDCSKQAQWLTSSTAGTRAWLDVLFTNKP